MRSVACARCTADVIGHIPCAGEHVFLSPEGCTSPRHTTNSMRLFDRVLDRAGIEKIDAVGEKLDIHALHHTCATRHARSGAPLVHTQRLLGHSGPKLTARAYTHLDVEDLRPAVEALPALAAAAQRAKEAAL